MSEKGLTIKCPDCGKALWISKKHLWAVHEKPECKYFIDSTDEVLKKFLEKAATNA